MCTRVGGHAPSAHLLMHHAGPSTQHAHPCKNSCFVAEKPRIFTHICAGFELNPSKRDPNTVWEQGIPFPRLSITSNEV